MKFLKIPEDMILSFLALSQCQGKILFQVNMKTYHKL